MTAQQFIRDFRALTAPEVNLSVNSPGGSLFDGISIYTALASSGKKITAKVMGVAASAASLVVMAASKIVMPKNTHLMIHKAGWVAAGNADDFRAQAAVLDSLDASIVATYAARTGKPEAVIQALLDAGDTWMTAEEAVAAGFADEATPLVTVTALFDLDSLPAAIRNALTPPAPVAPLPTQIEALAVAAGLGEYSAVFALDPAITTIEAAQAALDQTRYVVALCAAAKHPEMVAAFVKARTPTAGVQAKLIAVRAAEDEALPIQNSLRAGPITPVFPPVATGPVAMWATRKT